MKVYYKRAVEGVTVPAVIHNGSYFYIDMPVYEDGIVSCWKEVALADVPGVIQSGWLTSSVPEGKTLVVHGLTEFRLQNAVWDWAGDAFFEYIQSVVKSMNHKMEGIYAISAEKKELWEKRRVEWGATGTPFSVSGDYGYTRREGRSTHVFTAFAGVVRLENITAFADGTYALGSLGTVTEDELNARFAQNLIFTTPPLGAPIHMDALGVACASEIVWAVSAEEKRKEIFDYKNALNDKPTLHDAAVSAYHAYLEDPTDYHREKLRAAYEAVPEHERLYLGDMDSKDWDYQRILYSDEKRQV
ncbi:MAG: hypothetical protein LBK56_02335 [Gracilibacteraceae bacterium]|jgi:hypothetical protein|nr:hypothetical protein [Gracilibacteraceae bacterium]